MAVQAGERVTVPAGRPPPASWQQQNAGGGRAASSRRQRGRRRFTQLTRPEGLTAARERERVACMVAEGYGSPSLGVKLASLRMRV